MACRDLMEQYLTEFVELFELIKILESRHMSSIISKDVVKE
jgi:hypothetical protein